jgi:hypothetical protein
MSQRFNFTADAGDDLTLAVQVRPVRDLTSATLQCVFSDRTGAIKLTLTTSDVTQIQVIDGPGANANVYVSALNSGTTLGPGEWNYKVQRTDGKMRTLVKGRMSLKGD